MKILGIAILVLAVVVAAVPQFTDCESQGRALTLQNGRTVPMKCHWTAQAALGLGLPLAMVGGLLALNRRRSAQRNLGAMGVGLGALAVLLPTYLIGVCASSDMLCRSLMLPTLILAGSLIILASGAAVLLTFRQPASAPGMKAIA